MQIMPDWERLAAHIEADPVSKEQLGWVREMYAFSVAAALQGIHLNLAQPPLNRLITQPPADANLGQAAMLHYTWGSVFQNSSGGKIWEFDKRAFTDASIVTTVSMKGLVSYDAEVVVYTKSGLFKHLASYSVNSRQLVVLLPYCFASRLLHGIVLY